MKNSFSRRNFVLTSAIAGAGFTLTNSSASAFMRNNLGEGTRVGMIGLDTSHCLALTKALNDPKAGPEFAGYKVIAAYPTAGSSDIPSSISRLARITEQVMQQGVEIVGSIEELLKKVDVVLLETIDGRKHLEQALPVLKAGKRLFIDKPVSASLREAIAIFDAAKKYNVPVFSSSSLRYIGSAQEVVQGKIGKVLGADTFSPAIIEKSHPDLFWYGIHGVEILFTVMGQGCKSVVRVQTEGTDIVVGTWDDGRIGTFRGTRTGKHDYGGTVFGEKGEISLGTFGGYDTLLVKIIEFFKTGKVPVSPSETIEICAFMEAADESKLKGGVSVDLETLMQRAQKSKE
jgi:predicted dehydrogenase